MVFCIILIFRVNIGVAKDENLIMPEELLEIAKENSCTQVDDFYKGKPGMVKPPFVYSYTAGSEEDSAVFWCQKIENNKKYNYLLFMFKKPNELAACAKKVEWKNPPRGLSLYKDSNTTLETFVYINNPKKKGPKNERLKHNAILSEYDGVEELFYCYEGEWLVRQRH